MFGFNLEIFFTSIFILVCFAVQAASLKNCCTKVAKKNPRTCSSDYHDITVKLTFETENVKTVLKEFSQINHMNRC